MHDNKSYNAKGKLSASQSTDTAVKKVAGGHYGEDLADEKRSAKAHEYEDKLKGHSAPQKEVQGPLKAIGGGSAEAPSFPLY